MGSLFGTPAAPSVPPPPPAPPMFANNQLAGTSVAQQAAAANGQGSDRTVASSPLGASAPSTAKTTLGAG